MTWYIEQAGQPKKIPEEVLIYKIQNQELDPDILVINEILKAWTPLRQTDIWEENCPVRLRNEEFVPPPIPVETDNEEPWDIQTTERIATSPKRQPSKTGKRLVRTLAIAVAVVGVAAGLYRWWLGRQREKKIESYIEYAKENLPGMWVNRNSSTGNEYWEIYSDGTMVLYSQSAGITDRTYVAIETYGTWSILDVKNMEEEEYQLQTQLLTESENPKVIQEMTVVQMQGSNLYELEFLDRDTIQRGNMLFYRIGEEPEITESAVGLYVGETDERMFFMIGAIDGNRATYNWRYWNDSNGDLYEPYGYEGICEISPNCITLIPARAGIVPFDITFTYGDKKLFSQYDFDLFFEVAPSKGSGTYKKISDFSAMLERETFIEDPIINDIPQDETGPNNDTGVLPANEVPIQVYYSGEEPSGLEFVAELDDPEFFSLGHMLVTLTTSAPVQNLRVVGLDIEESDNEGIQLTVSHTAYDIGELLPGQAISVGVPVGEVYPVWGFVYTDEEGVFHAFSAYEEGEGLGYDEFMDIYGRAPGIGIREDVRIEQE